MSELEEGFLLARLICEASIANIIAIKVLTFARMIQKYIM